MNKKNVRINVESINTIRKMLDKNPNIVFDLLEILQNFDNYNGHSDMVISEHSEKGHVSCCYGKKFNEEFIPSFNPINCITGTKNNRIISKYMIGSHCYTNSELKQIGDSLINELNKICIKDSYQETYPENYKFLKSLNGIPNDEFEKIGTKLSAAKCKEISKKILSMTLNASEDEIIKIANSKEVFEMCINVIYKASNAGILEYKALEKAVLNSENALIVLGLVWGNYCFDSEFEYGKLYPKIELLLDESPKWLCARLYSFYDVEEYTVPSKYTKDSTKSLVNKAALKANSESNDKLISFIDELHLYDRDDAFTTGLVKKYFLKPGEKLRKIQ